MTSDDNFLDSNNQLHLEVWHINYKRNHRILLWNFRALKFPDRGRCRNSRIVIGSPLKQPLQHSDKQWFPASFFKIKMKTEIRIFVYHVLQYLLPSYTHSSQAVRGSVATKQGSKSGKKRRAHRKQLVMQDKARGNLRSDCVRKSLALRSSPNDSTGNRALPLRGLQDSQSSLAI